VVSEVSEPLRQLNVVLEAMFIAHETIYDLHRKARERQSNNSEIPEPAR
jgi:hypothetical protein